MEFYLEAATNFFWKNSNPDSIYENKWMILIWSLMIVGKIWMARVAANQYQTETLLTIRSTQFQVSEDGYWNY